MLSLEPLTFCRPPVTARGVRPAWKPRTLGKRRGLELKRLAASFASRVKRRRVKTPRTSMNTVRSFNRVPRLACVGGIIALLLVLPVQTFGGRDAGQPQWILVTAPAFREEVGPLIDQRRADGFNVAVISAPEQLAQTATTPLLARIRELRAAARGPSYLLLFGAVSAPDSASAAQTVVPPLRGTVGRMRDQPQDYAYGLPDESGAPTLAVGRLPARTTGEARALVRKTLRFERDREPGRWQNRLVLLAGNPGGGPLAEMMIEPATLPRLQRLDPAWRLDAIFNNSGSRFYLPPTRAHDAALRSFEEGEVFALFLGHSAPPALWLAGTNFLTGDELAGLKIPHGAGVFFTCGCYACQWRGEGGEGYGVAALRNPDGPVAVIGASGESYTAAGTLAVDGLLNQCAKRPFPARLGEYWLAIQSGLARGPIDDLTFRLYDQFDGSQGRTSLAEQRREHLEMWMLLGDPALRLPLVPTDLMLMPPPSVRAGQLLTINGELPARLANAKVHVTLERPLASVPADLESPPPSSPDDPGARERLTLANAKRANTFILSGRETTAMGTGFTCSLTVPPNLPWSNVVVRAYAATRGDSALAAISAPVAP